MSQTELVADLAPRRTMPAPNVPIVDFDPYSEEVLTDPYGYYEELREAGPLVWLREYEVYAVGRHEQATRILTDPKTYCSSAGVGLTNFHTEKPWRKPSIILEVDPPEHSRTRKVFVRILPASNPSTSRAITCLDENFLQRAPISRRLRRRIRISISRHI